MPPSTPAPTPATCRWTSSSAWPTTTTLAVRRLAADLLQARDPRKEVGLEAWGRLLESRHGLELAAAALRKHFGARELTPEWFRDRLFTKNAEAFDFVQKLLLQIHPVESLGPGYFVGLIEAADAKETSARASSTSSPWPSSPGSTSTRSTATSSAACCSARPRSEPPSPGSTRAGSSRRSSGSISSRRWPSIPTGKPTRGSPPSAATGRAWARELKFDEALSEKVLGWLGDVRRFAPADLGFEWLLQLAARGEPRYHNFAVETMIKGFTPADFAPTRARGRRGDRRGSGGRRSRRRLVPVHRQAGDDAAQGGRGQGPTRRRARWPRA